MTGFNKEAEMFNKTYFKKTRKSIMSLLALSFVALVSQESHAEKPAVSLESNAVDFRIKYFDLSTNTPTLYSDKVEDRPELEKVIVSSKCFEKQVRGLTQARKNSLNKSLLKQLKGSKVNVELEVTYGPERDANNKLIPKMAELLVWKYQPDGDYKLVNSDRWTGKINSCRVSHTRLSKLLKPVAEYVLNERKEKRKKLIAEKRQNIEKRKASASRLLLEMNAN